MAQELILEPQVLEPIPRLRLRQRLRQRQREQPVPMQPERDWLVPGPMADEAPVRHHVEPGHPARHDRSPDRPGSGETVRVLQYR